MAYGGVVQDDYEDEFEMEAKSTNPTPESTKNPATTENATEDPMEVDEDAKPAASMDVDQPDTEMMEVEKDDDEITVTIIVRQLYGFTVEMKWSSTSQTK